MGDAAYMSAAFEQQSVDSAADRAWALLVEAAHELNKAIRRERKPEEVAQFLWASLHGINGMIALMPT
jgi:hypothetical protein